MEELANQSVIGRLLEEISWEGRQVRRYRDGGRGMENVLTAEVLLPLSYLPRSEFLGEVLRSAHGADAACDGVAGEIEEAEVTLLPEESSLVPSGTVVQPDGVILTPGWHVMLEAKGTRPGAAFQPEQLPREYLALLQDAGDKGPLLLLVLSAPPPVAVRVKGDGLRRLSLTDAMSLRMEDAFARTKGAGTSIEQLIDRLPQVLAWITWQEIGEVVSRQSGLFKGVDGSVGGTVRRLCDAVTTAVEWHASRPAIRAAPSP